LNTSILNPKIFIRAGGSMGGIVHGINPGAWGTAVKPLKKRVQFFPGPLSPDFNIAIRSIANPAGYAPELGFVDAGITETNTLDTALDTGKKGGKFRNGRAGGFHRSPSS
jgi:hypothetical protein